MRKPYLVPLFAVAMSGPAFAAGLVEPVPEPVIQAPAPVIIDTAPAFSFAGGYAGAGIGTGTFTIDGDDGIADQAEDLFNAIDDDDSAAYYQLHAGYNFQRGNFVFGPEIALFNGESEVGDEFQIGGATTASDAEVGFGGRLMGRAGYSFGRFMPYVAVGASYLEVENDGDDLSDTGIAYGLGGDFLVTDRFMVGLEYVQNDFDEFDDSDTDVDYETIGLKASFRF